MHVYDVSGSIIDGLQHSPTIDIKQQGYQLVTSFLLFCWKHLLAILAPLLGWKELFPVSIADKENIFEWYYQGFSAISAFGINNTHILSFGIRKIRFIFYWNVMNALCVRSKSLLISYLTSMQNYLFSVKLELYMINH